MVKYTTQTRCHRTVLPTLHKTRTETRIENDAVCSGAERRLRATGLGAWQLPHHFQLEAGWLQSSVTICEFSCLTNWLALPSLPYQYIANLFSSIHRKLLGTLLERVVGASTLKWKCNWMLIAFGPNSIWSCGRGGAGSKDKGNQIQQLHISKYNWAKTWIKINILWHLYGIICHKADSIFRKVWGSNKRKGASLWGGFRFYDSMIAT